MPFAGCISELTRGLRRSTRPQTTPSGRPVYAISWGITCTQLFQLLRDCRASEQWNSEDNVRVFVDKFVKPRTDGTGMGLSLTLNQDNPKPVNLMVSHSWDENAEKFILDVAAEMRQDEAAFICFLALYQGGAQAISDQLGDSVADGPFSQVIRRVKLLGGRMLVVPNEELKVSGQGLYSRMWCDFEIYTALRAGCYIQFSKDTSQDHLFGSSGSSFSSRSARCGNPALPVNDDELSIRREIETMPVLTRSQSRIAGVISTTVMYFLSSALLQALWQSLSSGIYVEQSEYPDASMFSLQFLTWLFSWPVLMWAGIFLSQYPVARLSKALLGAVLRNRDGYTELDSCIRQATLLQLRHPGRMLDPKMWRPVLASEEKPKRCSTSCPIAGKLFGLILGVLLFVLLYMYSYLFKAWRFLDPTEDDQCLEWASLGPIGFLSLYKFLRCLKDWKNGAYSARAPDGSREAAVWMQVSSDVAQPVAYIVFSIGLGCAQKNHFDLYLWLGTCVGFIITALTSYGLARARREDLTRSRTLSSAAMARPARGRVVTADWPDTSAFLNNDLSGTDTPATSRVHLMPTSTGVAVDGVAED